MMGSFLTKHSVPRKSWTRNLPCSTSNCHRHAPSLTGLAVDTSVGHLRSCPPGSIRSTPGRCNRLGLADVVRSWCARRTRAPISCGASPESHTFKTTPEHMSVSQRGLRASKRLEKAAASREPCRFGTATAPQAAKCEPVSPSPVGRPKCKTSRHVFRTRRGRGCKRSHRQEPQFEYDKSSFVAPSPIRASERATNESSEACSESPRHVGNNKGGGQGHQGINGSRPRDYNQGMPSS